MSDKNSITHIKVKVEHRDKLKKISEETGMHMGFITGKLIEAKYKEVFGNVTKS